MKLTVVRDGIVEEVFLKEGECVQDGLARLGESFVAPCGGNGTCGKCRIKVLKGYLPVTSKELRLLKEEQINEGIRLACQAYIAQDVTIEIEKTQEYEVLTNTVISKNCCEYKEQSKYGVAIDIGTTTIAMELIEIASGEVLESIGELNRQSCYGADVISRIAAYNQGKGDELRKIIREQLEKMMQKLSQKNIAKIVIAANTTMIHILMGYECNTLGVYPYEPVNINTIRINSRQLFGEKVSNCDVVILPGISTYIGADITAGLLSCGFDNAQKVSVFIDLGTNGEMAIGTKNRILVSSAAAGPAFEGGNISCGIGSVPGAVSSVDIVHGMAKVKTIQEKEPVGVCGSGVLELTSELLVNHLIDETGLLHEDYQEEGFPVMLARIGEIVFLQEDIREVQMAKSAVCSALILLVKKYGIELEEVNKVYLAGGFGVCLNIKKAVQIGLIPKQWGEKIEPVGNTALKGAELVVKNDKLLDLVQNLIEVSEELTLAEEPEFGQLYMDHMFFRNFD